MQCLTGLTGDVIMKGSEDDRIVYRPPSTNDSRSEGPTDVFQRLYQIPFQLNHQHFLLDFVSGFIRMCYLEQFRELKRANTSIATFPLASSLLVFCLCKEFKDSARIYNP